MNEITYSIILKGKFSKKIFSDVRGHAFPKDLPAGWLMFTTVDRKHHIVNIAKYNSIEFSKEFDYIQENARNQQMQNGSSQQMQQGHPQQMQNGSSQQMQNGSSQQMQQQQPERDL